MLRSKQPETFNNPQNGQTLFLLSSFIQSQKFFTELKFIFLKIRYTSNCIILFFSAVNDP